MRTEAEFREQLHLLKAKVPDVQPGAMYPLSLGLSFLGWALGETEISPVRVVELMKDAQDAKDSGSGSRDGGGTDVGGRG